MDPRTPLPLVFFVSFFLFWFAFYALFQQGVPTGSDSERYFLVAQSLVERGSVAVDYDSLLVLEQGRGGKYYTKFGIGQSLVEAPFYWLGSRLAGQDRASGGWFYYTYYFTMLSVPAVSALALVLFLIWNLSLGYSRGVALAATLVLGLATMMWPYAHVGFSEPLQACCLTGIFLLLYPGRHRAHTLRAAGAGLIFALLILTKFANVLMGPPLLLLVFLNARGRPARHFLAPAAALLLPAALGVAGYLLFNYVRFDNWFYFGYEGFLSKDLASPLPGLYGLLLSSGKGVFFYMPVAVAALAGAHAFHKRHPGLSTVMWLCSGLLLLLYGSVSYWDGSLCWGPRYLVTLIPLFMLPLSQVLAGFRAMRPRARAGLIALIILSAGIQVTGVSINEYAFENKVPTADMHIPGLKPTSRLHTRFVPQFSPIAGHWWMFKHLALHSRLPQEELQAAMRRDFPWRDIVSPAKPLHPEYDLQWDFWWKYLPQFHEDLRPRVRTDLGTFLFLAASNLAVCAILLFLAARRRSGADPAP